MRQPLIGFFVHGIEGYRLPDETFLGLIRPPTHPTPVYVLEGRLVDESHPLFWRHLYSVFSFFSILLLYFYVITSKRRGVTRQLGCHLGFTPGQGAAGAG